MKIIDPSVELIDDVNAADVYSKIERCGRVAHQSKPREETVGEFVRNESAIPFIRMLIKRGHESVLEHVSLTFHIICDRAIMAELTRHRLASFSVESTRYCKYDELAYIKPDIDDEPNYFIWLTVVKGVENFYRKLIKNGNPPEQARVVLPLCTKTELYMTANLREWRHILKLRTAKAAHPQMRFIANQILNILRDKLPVIVEDIGSIKHEDND